MTQPIDEAELALLAKKLQDAMQHEKPSETILEVVAQLEKAGLDLQSYPLGRLKEAAQTIQKGWILLKDLEQHAGTTDLSITAIRHSFTDLVNAVRPALQSVQDGAQLSPWLKEECSKLQQASTDLIIRLLNILVSEGTSANQAPDQKRAEELFALAAEVSAGAADILAGTRAGDLQNLSTKIQEGLARAKGQWFRLIPRWVLFTAIGLLILGAALLFLTGYSLGHKPTPAPNPTIPIPATIAPTKTPTKSPSATSTALPTPTSTQSATPTSVATPTKNPITPTPVPTNTNTPRPVATSTLVPTNTRTPAVARKPGGIASTLGIVEDTTGKNAQDEPKYPSGPITFVFKMDNTSATEKAFVHLGITVFRWDDSTMRYVVDNKQFADAAEEKRLGPDQSGTFTVKFTLAKGRYKACISYQEPNQGWIIEEQGALFLEVS